MTRWITTATMLAISFASIMFAWIGFAGPADPRGATQVTLSTLNASETVHQEATSLPIFCIPRKMSETGVGGFGRPTRTARAFCDLAPPVCISCFAPSRAHLFRFCRECRASCGNFDSIDATPRTASC